jgi:hypothetical protein
MITGQQIVNDVLTELRLAAGQDVQIHLQDGILKNASRLYRSLNREYTFRDYLTYTTIATSITDGAPTTDVSGYLTRFSNIRAVFLENTNDPLPTMAKNQNPLTVKRPVIVPLKAQPTKVFSIYPKQDRTNVMLVTKSYTTEDFELDTEIDFDRDILATGAAFMLATKMSINDALTQGLGQQFTKLLRLAVEDELYDYQTNLTRGTYPLEWYEEV